MKPVLLISRIVVALGALVALSCDGDQPPPRLDLLPAAPTKTDAEAERLRKMQLITAILDGAAQQMEDSLFEDAVFFGCNTTLNCTIPVIGGSSCADACDALQDVCEAKTYLALTRPQAQLVEIPGTGISVPEQNETEKQKLAALGLNRATLAANLLDGMLQTFSGTGSSSSCDANTKSVPFDGTPLSTFAANTFADTYDLYKQLQDAYVKASVNSADSEFDSTPSTADAAVRALTQRLAGARKLGGEVNELPGAGSNPFATPTQGAFPANAFCTRSSAPPAVRAAIAVIRDAAVAPIDLLARDPHTGVDIVSTMNLIDGTAPGGSVRQRLAEFYWGVLDPPMGVQAT